MTELLEMMKLMACGGLAAFLLAVIYGVVRFLLTPSIMDERLARSVGETLVERAGTAAEADGEGPLPPGWSDHIKECSYNAILIYTDLWRRRGGGKGRGVVDEKLAEEAARLTGERYGELMPTESERLAAREQCTAIARKAIEGYMELYIPRDAAPSIMDEPLAWGVAKAVAEDFKETVDSAAEEDGEDGLSDEMYSRVEKWVVAGITIYTGLWQIRGGGTGGNTIDAKLADEAAESTGKSFAELQPESSGRSTIRECCTILARRGIEAYMQAYIDQAAARQPQV
jgi:hypothetical protein